MDREVTSKDNPLYSQELIFRNLKFDLKALAFMKLKDISNGDRIKYVEGRAYLCRMFHIRRLTARRLILELSKEGCLEFKSRGWMILREVRA